MYIILVECRNWVASGPSYDYGSYEYSWKLEEFDNEETWKRRRELLKKQNKIFKAGIFKEMMID